MAGKQDASKDIRGIVVAEVSRQLAPLEQKVDRAFNSIERLYNSNGGPPGFLQTARKEDDGRFKMIFSILDEHKADIKPIKDFIRDHETRERQRDQDRVQDAALLASKVKESDRRFKRFIALWSLGIALFMVLIALYDHRDGIKRTLLDVPPAAHSENHPPQDAATPLLHYQGR